MIVSLVVILLILILGVLYSQGTADKRNGDKNRKNYIKSVSIILILQSGLRNVAVGADTFWYSIRFEEMKTTTWAETFNNFIDYFKFGVGKDPGYDIFQKVVQIIFSENQLFLVVIAILFFVALGRFIYYNITKLNHAILAFVLYSVLFYSFFSITGHRQTIATAVALYSFEWIKKRKLFPFVIALLIASTIHKSVLIVLPFYFLANFKRPKLLYGVALVVFPVLMVLKEQMTLILQNLGGYELYEIYEGAGTYTFTSMYLLISIVALFRMKYVLKMYPIASYYYNALAIGLLFLPLTWVNPSAMRIVQYFSIFMLVLMPFVVQSFQQYSNKVQKAVMFMAIALLIILFMKSAANVEYKFFWQQMPLEKHYI